MLQIETLYITCKCNALHLLQCNALISMATNQTLYFYKCKSTVIKSGKPHPANPRIRISVTALKISNFLPVVPKEVKIVHL